MQRPFITLYFLVSFFLLSFAVSSCKKSKQQERIPETGLPESEVVKIPVVVHVIYDQPEYNITEEKIISQLKVLNEDFRKRNTDLNQVPAMFAPLIADVGIAFELVKTDPQGKPTIGITRTFSHVDGWQGRVGVYREKPAAELPLYHTAQGGADIWPADRYLNLYVVLMADYAGRVGLAGYAQLPGKDPLTDAVVIDPRCFGTVAPLAPNTELGRTLTHEIGHWLNLNHVFDEPDDGVEDTPHGHMAGNFMDYAADNQLLMFTTGQRQRMRAVFKVNQPRRQLYLNQLQ